jgi:hypothetical protein
MADGELTWLAAIAAGGFAIWRVTAGHYTVGLSMKVGAKRSRAFAADKHDLAITIRLKKPAGSALSLQSIQVAVKEGPTVLSEQPIMEVQPGGLGRTLNLAPHDELQFSAYAQIPATAVVEVSVLLKGQRLLAPILARLAPWLDRVGSRDSFWTASAISVPGAVTGPRQRRGAGAEHAGS